MSKVKLNNVRVSYVSVFKARAMQEGQDPKYSLQVILPKDHAQVREVKKAILEAGKEKFEKMITGNSFPARLKNPLRDGDEMDDDTYSNSYFFNANNMRRPLVINRDKTPITEEDGIIYSGCYCNVVIEFYAFDKAGNKGVAASLGGIQFKRDGEALGGRGATVDDFDEEDFEEDDEYDI